MFRRVALALVAGLLISPAAGIPTSVETCMPIEQRAGACGTQSSGNTLTVSGERTTPGTSDSSDPQPDSPNSDSEPGPAPRNVELEKCLKHRDANRSCFRSKPTEPPAASTQPEGTPPITIADLATFSPAPAQPIAEPGNVGILGMPANFVANATTHMQTGTLFGTPVTVRFTPAGYDFRYGDGTTSTLTTGGRTWAALGQPQFTPTATSHVYRTRGAYAADVTVRYTAEVDLGTGWFTVPGELTTPGPTQQIRIFQAHTALVAHTCTENPAAPGC